MSGAPIQVKTNETREDNPKAVFFGDNEAITTPLALYLNARSVDLFSAKSLDDAVFGNYFFYVGVGSDVKIFLEQKNTEPPKTLLLLVGDSDMSRWKEIQKKHPQVKIVVIDGDELNDQEAEQVMDFFLGSSEHELFLTTRKTQPTMVVKEVPTEAKKVVPEEEVAPFKEEKAQAAQSDNSARWVTEEVHDAGKAESSESKAVLTDRFSVEIPEERPQPETTQKTETKKENSGQSEPKETGRTQRNPWRRAKTGVLAAALSIVFIFIAFPLVSIVGGAALAGFYGRQAKSAIETHSFDKGRVNLDRSLFFIGWVKKNLNASAYLFYVLNQRELHRQLSQATSVGEQLAQGYEHVLDTATETNEIFGAVIGQEQGVALSAVISSAKGNLTLADNELAEAEAQLKTDSLNNLFSQVPFSTFKKNFDEIKTQVYLTRENIRSAKAALTLLPDLVGVNQKKVYLVVFQNNMELRPTGGFIGSYGLLTFEEGRLADVTVEDVYTADGALKGHVDPPDPIRVYLEQEHWYMRDSNWDPDFVQTGARLAWFLEKEIDVHVDGVLAVDLFFAQKLLEATGDIHLTDYDTVVTADNLFLTAHNQINNDFFPGSTQKKDFLGALARSLIMEVTSKNTLSRYDLFAKLQQTLQEKHALLFFNNQQAQKIAEDAGWAGKLDTNAYCNSEPCIKDYLAVVDANLGVNKVNYFVTRNIKDVVHLESGGSVTHELAITYQNNSPKGEGVGGSYKDYVRVLTPEKTAVLGAQVDNLPLQLVRSDLASASAVATASAAGREVVSYFLEVPPQTTKTLTLTLQNSFDVSQQPFTYELFMQKQPGTEGDEAEVTILYPESWQALAQNGMPLDVAGAVSLANAGKITYNTALSEDRRLEVYFSP